VAADRRTDEQIDGKEDSSRNQDTRLAPARFRSSALVARRTQSQIHTNQLINQERRIMDNNIIAPSNEGQPIREEMIAADNGSNEEAPEPSEQELQEVLEIFKEARRGLTEDGVAAVLALRREIAIHQALVDLLLDGKIDAEVIDRNEKLTVRNFRLRALSADEQLNETDSLS
jgi:hypothetical protein